jgi:hypothetical protein
MEVYIANLGERNAHWPACRSESVLTLETGTKLLDFWKNNDRDGWLSWATKNERMINGQIATAAVASRWFNLITIFHNTTGDIWIHRDGDYLFWTKSIAGAVVEVPINDPSGNPPSLPEHRLEQFLRAFESLRREDHRFHFADGIVNHALVVQAAEYVPVHAFPGAAVIVESQIEQRQRCVVDLVGIEGHREPLAANRSLPSYSGSRRVQPVRTRPGTAG